MLQAGRVVDALRVNQTAIDGGQEELSLANFGMTAALAASVGIRALCRCNLGIEGWKADFDEAIAMGWSAGDPTAYAAASMYKYVFAMHNGAVLPSAGAEESTAAAVEFAGRASEDFAYEAACLSRGMVLIYGDGTRRAEGYNLVRKIEATLLRSTGRSTCGLPTRRSRRRRPGPGYSPWCHRIGAHDRQFSSRLGRPAPVDLRSRPWSNCCCAAERKVISRRRRSRWTG